MNNEILKVRIKNLIKKSQRHNAEFIFLIWSLQILANLQPIIDKIVTRIIMAMMGSNQPRFTIILR